MQKNAARVGSRSALTETPLTCYFRLQYKFFAPLFFGGVPVLRLFTPTAIRTRYSRAWHAQSQHYVAAATGEIGLVLDG